MKRNKFSLSRYKLATFDQGELVPCGLTEVLPGDTFQISSHALIRVSPLLAPVMHPVVCRIHHFFVPHRLVWDNWEDFITGGPDGMDDSVFPTRSFPGGVSQGGLADYYGIPPVFGNLVVSALPFRGYAAIWNEWYRDQDLQTPLVISTADGNDTTTNVLLQNVAWEKDYFTSARPWPQKGPEVSIPLGTEAPVLSSGTQPKGRGAAGVYGNLITSGSPNPNIQVTGTSAGAFDWGAAGATDTGLYADLTDATAISVNDLREALALQRMAEARARYGSRYTEYLRYLGVRSSDARLQRPEYLGGGSQTIQFSEVLQTGVTTSGNDALGVGNLKGHGISAMRSRRSRRFFEEHGYIHSFISVKPKTMYSQGINKTWLRRTKEDFYQKELEHIGQQEIQKQELYCGLADLTATWGYQDRYDDYRRIESGIAGEFRTTLNFWHMAREFSSAPTLNASFVQSNPTKRILAVNSTDGLWAMVHHSMQVRRQLSKTGTSFTM